MRILITGNMGYVGWMLVRHLRQTMPSATLVGYDRRLLRPFTGARALPETLLNEQHYGDARELAASLFRGVDAVVHLAAISRHL
jgi:nucleoside-diphosphate-sugar epimerase